MGRAEGPHYCAVCRPRAVDKPAKKDKKENGGASGSAIRHGEQRKGQKRPRRLHNDAARAAASLTGSAEAIRPFCVFCASSSRSVRPEEVRSTTNVYGNSRDQEGLCTKLAMTG